MSMPDTPVTLIKDIRPGQRQLTSDFIVLEIYASTKTKEGKDVATVKVADASGSINVVLYGDYVTALQPSDVLRMTCGYSVVYKGSMCLYMAKHGSLTKIGEFCFLFSEVPNMSDPSAEFLNEYNNQQQQQQNGRGTSPPNYDIPPEPTGQSNFQSGAPRPGPFPPQQAWSQSGQVSLSAHSDPTSRLQPLNFDSSNAPARNSPPQSAKSPPPFEQSSLPPRSIPSQTYQAGAPVAQTSSGPVDPRASRGGQNRYHPYQQQQQQSQQRQPLQPIGAGTGGAAKSSHQQPPHSRSFSQSTSRTGPPVIPPNPSGGGYRSSQYSASVRR